MRLFRAFALALACSPIIAVVASPLRASKPTAKELVSMAPTIASSDEQCKSIELGGYLKENGHVSMKFRAIYAAPDKFALLICDGMDGAPLLYASDHKMIMYDPTWSAVLYAQDASGMEVFLKQEEDGLKFACSVESTNERKNLLLFDIQSLFRNAAMRDEVVEVKDGKYRLTRVSKKGNSLVCHIDLALKQPYTKVELLMHDKNLPSMCIDKIIINGLLTDNDFAFPTMDRIAKKLPVKDWPNNDIRSNNGRSSSKGILQARRVRLAIYHPELRDSIESPTARRINWNAIRKNDNKLASAMAEFIPSKFTTP